MLTALILPVAAYVLLTMVFRRAEKSGGVPDAAVKAHLIVFAFIAVSTEWLSAAEMLTSGTLLLCWMSFVAICMVAVWRRRKQGAVVFGVSPRSRFENLLIGGVALFLTVTLATALLYPPNNYDSMTYHMPRVVHWITQQSVDFYPTQITRQNSQLPLAEFAILHVQLLTDGDRFANLVQWVSYLCLLCLGPLVARELGLTTRQRHITLLVLATVPMVILQASSTQNDLVVAVFLMAFGLYMLRLRDAFTRENILFAAISLGLALLTKGTAYLYAAPIGIFLAIPLLNARKSSRRQFFLTGAALVSIVVGGLLFSAGHFQRNIQNSGHALDSGGEPYFNETKSGVVLGSNVLRNAALHLVTPNPQVSDWQVNSLRWLLGPHLENPQTTWYGMPFSLAAARHEDIAGNPLHFIGILVTVPFLVVYWVRGRHRRLIAYSFAVLGGALLFCWMLKWQPWHSRLHTPLFAMAAPLLAVTIDAIPLLRRFAPVVCVVFLLYGLPFAFSNVSRSLISLDWLKLDREHLYFNNRKDLYGDYKAATDLLKRERAQRVGLFLGGDDWEYPLWALTGLASSQTGINFQYVVGSGDPVATVDLSSLPGHVVATIPLEQWQHHARYAAIYSSETVSVFKLQRDPSEEK